MLLCLSMGVFSDWLVWGFLFGLGGAELADWTGFPAGIYSGIPKGTSSRGALLLCKFDINRDRWFCSTHQYHCNELIMLTCKHEDILHARYVTTACKYHECLSSCGIVANSYHFI